MKRVVILSFLLLSVAMLSAYPQGISQTGQKALSNQSGPLDGGKEQNQLNIGLQMLNHGEMRYGGLDPSESVDEDIAKAYFVMQRSRLSIAYSRPGLEIKVTGQHSGVWGQKGKGSFNLYESWARLSKNGFFVQMGRQVLSYDDERIIGSNDWAMAALSHDVLRGGYEGYGHKAHFILGFNQNAENTYGGSYYTDGAQPYKILLTGWYHYDFSKIPLGASVLFMDIGMQGGELHGQGDEAPANRFQQLFGGYLSYNPGPLRTEASYYRQSGRNEQDVKIDAWMASVKAQWTVSKALALTAGYDYLSGDKYFAVPGKGSIGLVQHDVIRGFSPVYGSHHKFYGMMDFFYVSTYHSGFTPGLQNLYAGASYSPASSLNLKATYHYMAIATHLDAIERTLGHDFDMEASWQVMKDVRFSAGFSFMTGTDSMQRLKRADVDSRLSWGWFSLNITPQLFSAKW